MAEFNLIVFDQDKIKNPEALGDMPEFLINILDDDKKILNVKMDEIINIVTFELIDLDKDIERINLILKSTEQYKIILLIFIKQELCDKKIVELLNDGFVSKIVFKDYTAINIKEEAINSSIILAGKFSFEDIMSNETKILDQVNSELELKNQWLSQEKQISIIFGDTSIELDLKLEKTFSKIIEFFKIEHYVYYSCNQELDSLKINYKFSSFKDIKQHVLTDSDEYSPVYVFYNKEKLFIDDYSKESRVQKNPNIIFNIDSQISLPVMSGEKLIGVIEFFNKLDVVAHQIPILVSNFLEKSISDLRYHIEINILKDEIQLSRNEMSDIFMNVDQGILTFSSNLNINPEYSKAALSILKKDNLEGFNIVDLLFENVLSKQDVSLDVLKDNFKTWTNSVFEMPEQWDMLKDLSTYFLEKKGPQYLELDYLPIIKNNIIEKIMLIITDVTVEKTNEEALKKQENEHNQKISMLMEIISMKPNIFHDFLKESFSKIKAISDIIESYDIENSTINESLSTDFLNNLFANVHAIKGSAGFMGLSSCNKKFHVLENSINAIKSNNDFSNIPQLIMKVQTETSYFSDIINNLLDLITEFAKYSLVENDENMELHSEILDLINKHKEYFSTINDDLLQELKDKASKTIFDYKNNIIENVKNKCLEAVSRQSQRESKQIEFEYDVSIDMPVLVLKKMESILIPLIINCIDHGIEVPEQRALKNKSILGKIGVKGFISSDSKDAGMLIYDNGAGISVEKIKATAEKKGIMPVSKLALMSDDEIINLIFMPAFSTKDQATATSGRGYGMDIVKRVLDSSNAEIKVVTKKDMWTMFRIFFKLDNNC